MSSPILLELDLTDGLLEPAPGDPVTAVLARRRPRLVAVLTALQQAGADPRVHGLVAHIGGPLTLAGAQELRDAVAVFRAAGKDTVAWSESFGELGPGTAGYLLASAFAEVWLQPSGDVGLTGVALRSVFLRDALARVGVRAEVGQRYEYKNAPDTFTGTGYSPAHREAAERLVSALGSQVVGAVARDRGLEPAAVRALVDRAPLTAAEALAAGLVDRLGYRDETYAAVRERAGGEVALLFAGRYAPNAPARLRRRLARRTTAVAVVPLAGGIRLGRSGRSLLTGPAAGSDSVTAALRAAGCDDDVRAVVLRVDSPGGSYAASDAVRREVVRLRAAGRPVVVSMGSVAASGGYLVAVDADLIVAQPATLTGSIGVFGGKPVLQGLFARAGVGVDAVRAGKHAEMFSSRRGFTDSEREQLERGLDRVYREFTALVAAGRRLEPEHVERIARGRVWAGSDAVVRGLVDRLGGLSLAVGLAAERAGARDRDEVRVRTVGRSAVARLRAPRSSEDRAALAGVGAPDALVGRGGDGFVEAWGALAGLAQRLGLPAGGPLLRTDLVAV